MKKQVLIDGLNSIKEKALNGGILYKTHGICSNWDEELGFNGLSYDLVEDLADGWEHHSGRRNSPVSGDRYGWNNMWEGEQLILRLSLIEHILRGLEKANQEWLNKLNREIK